MVDNEMVSRIAQKIRAVRLKKKLTIKELAERTKVTKGLLSKIENSRTIPSLPVFVQILQSLDISFKDFFEEMALSGQENYILIRKNDHKLKGPEDARGAIGLVYRHILGKNLPASNIEIFLLNIKPGLIGRARTANGYKFKHIISGTCEYHLNNEILKMKEGDSIYFNASIPHLAVNRAEKDVLMLVVIFRF